MLPFKDGTIPNEEGEPPMRCPRLGLIVLLASLGLVASPAAAADADNIQPKSFKWDFQITPAASDGTELTLTCVIPRTIMRRQKVQAMQYSHEPKEVWDEKGTRYARFQFKNLRAPDTLTIRGDIDLYKLDLATAKDSDPSTLPRERPWPDYLVAEKHIEKDAPQITREAVALRGQDDLETIQNTLAFVRKKLRYSKPKTPGGAVAALEQGHGVCLEFSDLFVALCRANRLHSRVCTGYVTDASDSRQQGWHAWVEVHLDKYGWIPFEPTTEGPVVLDRRKNGYVYLSWRRSDADQGYLRYTTRGTRAEVKDIFSIEKRTTSLSPAPWAVSPGKR
jgi:transglutaminase-like putative cysteine protease